MKYIIKLNCFFSHGLCPRLVSGARLQTNRAVLFFHWGSQLILVVPIMKIIVF